MFEARTAEGGWVHLEGSAARPGRLLRYDEARALATDLRCEYAHCDAPLVHRNGSDSRRAHWAHRPGEGRQCASAGTPEGAWHRYVKNDVLAACAFHEHAVVGARVDAVREHVSKAGTRRLFGIEVQHSVMGFDEAAARHAAHAEAGLACTLWLLDASRLGMPHATWTQAGQPANHQQVIPAAGPRPEWTARGWRTTDSTVVEILRGARQAGDHHVSVGFLLSVPGEGLVLRLAKTVLTGDRSSSAAAIIVGWSAPISETTLRGWAGATVHHPVLNALHQAKVLRAQPEYTTAA